MTVHANGRPALPPGRRGRRLWTLRRLMTDPTGFFEELHRDYGDLAWYEVPGAKCCALFSSELLEELAEKEAVFPPRYPRSRYDVVRSPGLARMRGDDHHRLARLVASAFSPDRMRIHAEIVAEQVEAHCRRLRARENVDIRYFAECLAWEATFGAVFGRDMRAAPEVARVLVRAVKLSYLLGAFPGGARLARLPLPHMLRALRASRELDALAYKAIRRARDPGHPGHDIVSHLVRAAEQGLCDWRFENDTRVRDEGFSLVFISYETTIIPLVYGAYYLSGNPGARKRLEQEADEVLGDRPPAGTDLPRLRYAHAVFNELIRVQSPAQTLVPRPALEDSTLGGHFIPRGTVVQVPLPVLHTRADYWDRADEFLPERWLSERRDETAACSEAAFAPFGRAPRACLGAPFATALAVLTLASLARRFRLEPVEEEIPKRMSADVAFFAGPILVNVVARDREPARQSDPRARRDAGKGDIRWG